MTPLASLVLLILASVTLSALAIAALAWQCGLLRLQITALRADLDRATAATWAARAERDDALISNEHLFDAVCHMHQERTQFSLALHGEPQHLPWHAGDHVVRDELKSGKAG